MSGNQDPATLAPSLDPTHPGMSAAFYYGEGLWVHYRKVVLAGCKESIRASVTIAGSKMTESRLDDLAHLHPAYLSFLAEHLGGRSEWLASYQKEGGMR